MTRFPPTLQTGLTLRALVIGLLLAFGIGVAGPFLSLYVQGANATAYFTSQMAHFLLFVLVGIVNVVLGVLRRSWVLNKGELVVVFIFMNLANSTHTMVFYWVPMVSSPFYYARTENNWLTLIVPHIPTWSVPHDSGVIREFFEGTDSGTSGIVWAVWLEPLIGWLPIFVALPLASLCLMVILRRRWVDQERLIYPVMQLSLSMVQDDERGSLIKPFFRSGIMWVGFAIPMIVGGIIGLHAYFPFIPTIELSAGIPIFGGIRLSFATLGFFF